MSDKQSSDLKAEITKYTTQSDALAKLQRGETLTITTSDKGEVILSLVNGHLSVAPVQLPNLKNAAPDSPVLKERLRNTRKKLAPTHSDKPARPGNQPK